MSKPQQRKRLSIDPLMRSHGLALFCIGYAVLEDINQDTLHVIQNRVGKWYRDIGKVKNWELHAEKAVNSLMGEFIAIKHDQDELNKRFYNKTLQIKAILGTDSKSSRNRKLILSDWSAILAVNSNRLSEQIVTYFEKPAVEIGASPQEFRMSLAEALRAHSISSSNTNWNSTKAEVNTKHSGSSPTTGRSEPNLNSTSDQIDGAGTLRPDHSVDPTNFGSDTALGAEIHDEAFKDVPDNQLLDGLFDSGFLDNDDESFNFETD